MSNAGGLGFVAAGYKTTDALGEEIAATRAATEEPFGVNVFAATPTEVSESALDAYADSVRKDTSDTGVEPGDPRSDDDHFDAKCNLLLADPVPVVSFTFGCPPVELVERFHGAGSEVWVTVTNVEEAEAAAEAGADALVALSLIHI